MKQLSSLNKYFWKYRWHFMLGIVFVVLTNYFRILAPQLTGYVVNTVVHSLEKKPAVEQDGKNYDILVRKVIDQFENNSEHKILYTALTLLVIAIISGFFMPGA
jgi:ATP-binding cassette subfamily B protein